MNSSHAICINDVVAGAAVTNADMIKQASKYKLIDEEEPVPLSNIVPARKMEKKSSSKKSSKAGSGSTNASADKASDNGKPP